MPGKPVKSWKVRRLEPYEGKNTFFLHLQGRRGQKTPPEAMKGASVTVPNDERVELEEDEYWLDDIIGLAVLDAGHGGKPRDG